MIKTKILLFAFLPFILLPFAKAFCNCEDLIIEEDCSNEKVKYFCFWNSTSSTCRQKQCSDITNRDMCTFINNSTILHKIARWDFKLEEFPDSYRNCYWKDSKCYQTTTCNDIIITDLASKDTCQKSGCLLSNDQSQCQNLTNSQSFNECDDIDDKTICEKAYLKREKCYWKDEQCRPESHTNNCGDLTADLCTDPCEFKNEQCIEKQCHNIKSDSECNKAIIRFTHCYYKDEECKSLPLSASCYDRPQEQICSARKNCIWDKDRCRRKECGDEPCGFDSRGQAFIGDDVLTVLFCKGVNGLCVETSALEVSQENCLEQTSFMYSWDGTKCRQCRLFQQIIIPMLINLIAILI